MFNKILNLVPNILTAIFKSTLDDFFKPQNIEWLKYSPSKGQKLRCIYIFYVNYQPLYLKIFKKMGLLSSMPKKMPTRLLNNFKKSVEKVLKPNIIRLFAKRSFMSLFTNELTSPIYLDKQLIKNINKIIRSLCHIFAGGKYSKVCRRLVFTIRWMMFDCLSVRLSVSLFDCPSVCLFVFSHT